jgi:hypothetical protein
MKTYLTFVKRLQELNVLKRIGKNLTKLGKLTIYYSFIMSTGHSLFIVLKTSRATVLNLLILREGIFDLHNNSP